MLILTDRDVERLLSMREAIEAVERAFAEYARGAALMPPRSTLHIDRHGGTISLMPSYLKETGAISTKIVAIYPRNPERGLPTTSAWIAANDPEDGGLVALIEATHLTAVRTGAATAVAARYLAPRRSRVAAVIGCGAQGRTQAWALAEAFDLSALRLFDLSRGRAERLAADLGPKLGVDAAVAGNCEEAVRGADIVATATTSKEPVISRDWLGEEAHVSAIGSFYPDHRELDTRTVREAKVVVDSREAALAEAGDLIIPLREGAIGEGHIHAELGEIILGRKEGRVEGDGLTVFKSVGLAIQDAAAVSIILRKWRKG